MSTGSSATISRIFIDENKLQPEYVPQRILHREEQLSKLSSYFRQFIVNPGSMYVRVVFTGSIGTGKTVVAKYFGSKMAERFRRFKFSYVNCHGDRTLFAIAQKIASNLGLGVPRRGYSTIEILHLIWNHLESTDTYLILVVDEIDYLVRTQGDDALYKLTRLPEILGKTEDYRIGTIFILRDLSDIMHLKGEVLSSLTRNVIRFEPYTSDQLYDILWARILEEKAMYEEAVSDEIIEMIAKGVGRDRAGSGDARIALEILYLAGKKAESEGRSYITPEDVKYAFVEVKPIPKDIITNLRLNEKLLLLALIRLSRSLKFSSKVPIGIVELEYADLCEEYGIRPRKHTAVWEYVQSLSKMGIIRTEKSRKGYKGKTTLISLPYIPSNLLEKELRKLIEQEIKALRRR